MRNLDEKMLVSISCKYITYHRFQTETHDVTIVLLKYNPLIHILLLGPHSPVSM